MEIKYDYLWVIDINTKEFYEIKINSECNDVNETILNTFNLNINTCVLYWSDKPIETINHLEYKTKNSTKKNNIKPDINKDLTLTGNDIIKCIVPEELRDSNVLRFTNECIQMIQLYAKKNHDYGNSFEQGMNTIGFAYGVGRLYDKINRIITLSKVKAEVTDESIEDTIRDLACYSVMTSMFISSIKKGKNNESWYYKVLKEKLTLEKTQNSFT